MFIEKSTVMLSGPIGPLDEINNDRVGSCFIPTGGGGGGGVLSFIPTVLLTIRGGAVPLLRVEYQHVVSENLSDNMAAGGLLYILL